MNTALVRHIIYSELEIIIISTKMENESNEIKVFNDSKMKPIAQEENLEQNKENLNKSMNLFNVNRNGINTNNTFNLDINQSFQGNKLSNISA